MGMQLFVKDEIFFPAQHGAGVGDVLNIVLVGAGCGGHPTTPGGVLGGASSFGNYAVAVSGGGAPGALGNTTAAAGGGGGFVPGAPFQGGSGMSPIQGGTTHMQSVYLTNTNGGGARGQYLNIFGANGAAFGGGGNIAGSYPSEGGAGYGAGGGCSPTTTPYGGNAGQILYYTHTVTPEDVLYGIPITIGFGGLLDIGIYQTLAPDGANAPLHLMGYASMSRVLTPTSYFAMSGVFGTTKLWECADGTMGLGAGLTTSAQFVKFRGVDAIYPMSVALPTFLQTAANIHSAVFYCNGYYVQFSNASDGTTLRWLEESKAKSGTATAADVGTCKISTGQAACGANLTDIIVAINATTLQVYQNWTPEVTAFSTITLNGALTHNPSSALDYHLLPTSATEVYLVKYNAIAIANSNMRRIDNYLTGATSLVDYSWHIQGTVGITPYVYSRMDTSMGYRTITSANNLTPSNNIMFTMHSTYNIRSVNARVATTKGYNFCVCEGDKIGFLAGVDPDIQPAITSYKTHGYNNIPGRTHANYGGGAGGCCMITW